MSNSTFDIEEALKTNKFKDDATKMFFFSEQFKNMRT